MLWAHLGAVASMRYQIWKPVNIYSIKFGGYRVYYVELRGRWPWCRQIYMLNG